MRLATFLLASYITFLTVQPMVSPAYACSTKKIERKIHTCCEKKESKQSQKENSRENQCPGVCNPFGQGTCCLGAAPSCTYHFNTEIALSDFDSFTSANFLSNYVADCFHPPEVV